MTTVAIVYASRHGHTAKIAHRLETDVRAAGSEVTLADLSHLGAIDPSDYDGLVVVGSIHMGKHDPHLVAWVREHADVLSVRPAAFVSVSISAANQKPGGAEQARDYVDEFEEETGWAPRHAYTVAGALQYREYGFVTRRVIRAIAAKGGLSTETDHDTEYTDWHQVDDIARELVTDLAAYAVR